MIKKLSIIIPAYNEGSTIHLILNKIREVILVGGTDKEIIIVNDCSTDDTESAILRYMNANPDMDIANSSDSKNNLIDSIAFN